MKKTLLALLAASSIAVSGGPAPCACVIQPDKAIAIRPAPGRVIYCGLDLGSKTAKLSVVSMEPGRSTTVKDERQCRRSLGFGTMVFDPKTSTPAPLPDGAAQDLVETIQEYQQICERDGGKIVAAGATQWARDATNIDAVRAMVKARTGLTMDVLTAQQEADYSYVAASLGQPGRIVLDPGSNSFEIAWQERGAASITSVLVKYGYVRASVNDMEPAADYASGRVAYQTKAMRQIEDELAKLSPPMTLALLRDQIRAGKLGSEIVALGQDGAVHLAVRGLLRESHGWIADVPAYDALIARQPRTLDASFGLMVASLTPNDVTAFFKGIGPEDFQKLTQEPIKGLYGQRTLVVPALVELLFRELGATRLVMVPQEITTGNILAHLGK